MQLEQKLREYKKILTIEAYLMQHRTQIYLDNIEGYSLDAEDIEKLNQSIQQSDVFDKIDDQIKNKSIQGQKNKTGYEKNFNNDLFNKVNILNKTFQKLTTDKQNNKELRKTIFDLNQQIQNSIIKPELLDIQDRDISHRKRNITQYYNDLKKQLYQQEDQNQSRYKFSINYSQNKEKFSNKNEIQYIKQSTQSNQSNLSKQSLQEIDQDIQNIDKRLSKILNKNNQRSNLQKNDNLLSERSFEKSNNQDQQHPDINNLDTQKPVQDFKKKQMQKTEDPKILNDYHLQKRTTQILNKYSEKINENNDNLLQISNISFQNSNIDFKQIDHDTKKIIKDKQTEQDQYIQNKKNYSDPIIYQTQNYEEDFKIIKKYLQQEQNIRQKYIEKDSQIFNQLDKFDPSINTIKYILEDQKNIQQMKENYQKQNIQEILQKERILLDSSQMNNENILQNINSLQINQNLKSYLIQQQDIKKNFLQRCHFQNIINNKEKPYQLYMKQKEMIQKYNIKPEVMYQQLRNSKLDFQTKKFLLNNIQFYEKMSNEQFDQQCFDYIKKNNIQQIKLEKLKILEDLGTDIANFVLDQNKYQQKLFVSDINMSKNENFQDQKIYQKQKLDSTNFLVPIQKTIENIQRKNELANLPINQNMKQYLTETFNLFKQKNYIDQQELVQLKKEIDKIDEKYLIQHNLKDEQINQEICNLEESNQTKQVLQQILLFKKQMQQQQNFQSKQNIDQDQFNQIQKFIDDDTFYRNLFQINESDEIFKLESLNDDIQMKQYFLEDQKIQNQLDLNEFKQKNVNLYQKYNLTTDIIIQKLQNIKTQINQKNYYIEREKLKQNVINNNKNYQQKKSTETNNFRKQLTLQNQKLIQKFSIDIDQLKKNLQTLPQNDELKNYILTDQQFLIQTPLPEDKRIIEKGNLQQIKYLQIPNTQKISSNYKNQIKTLPLTYQQKKYLLELQKIKIQLRDEIYNKNIPTFQENKTKKLQNIITNQENFQQVFDDKSFEEQLAKDLADKKIQGYLLKNKKFLNPQVINQCKLEEQLKILQQVKQEQDTFLRKHNLDVETLKDIINENIQDQKLKKFLITQEQLISKYDNIRKDDKAQDSVIVKKQDNLNELQNIISKLPDDKYKKFFHEHLNDQEEIRQAKNNAEQKICNLAEEQIKQLKEDYHLTDEYLDYKIKSQDIDTYKKQAILQQLNLYKRLKNEDNDKVLISKQINQTQQNYIKYCLQIPDKTIRDYLIKNDQTYKELQENLIQQENEYYQKTLILSDQLKQNHKLDSQQLDQYISNLNISQNKKQKLKQFVIDQNQQEDQQNFKKSYKIQPIKFKKAIDSLNQNQIKKNIQDIFDIQKKYNENQVVNIYTQKAIFLHQYQQQLAKYNFQHEQIEKQIQTLPINQVQKQKLKMIQNDIQKIMIEQYNKIEQNNENTVIFDDIQKNLSQSEFYEIIEKIDNQQFKKFLIDQKQILDCTQKKININQQTMSRDFQKSVQTYLKKKDITFQQIIDKVNEDSIKIDQKQVLTNFLQKQYQCVQDESFKNLNNMQEEFYESKLQKVILNNDQILYLQSKIQDSQLFDCIMKNNVIFEQQFKEQNNQLQELNQQFIKDLEDHNKKNKLDSDQIIKKVLELPFDVKDQQKLINQQLLIKQGKNNDQTKNFNLKSILENFSIQEDVLSQLKEQEDNQLYQYIDGAQNLYKIYKQKNKYIQEQNIKAIILQQINLQKDPQYDNSELISQIIKLPLESQIQKQLLEQQSFQYNFPLEIDFINIKQQQNSDNINKNLNNQDQFYDLESTKKHKDKYDFFSIKKYVYDMNNIQKNYNLSNSVILKKIRESQLNVQTKQSLVDNFIKQKFILNQELYNELKNSDSQIENLNKNIQELPESILKEYFLDNQQIFQNFVNKIKLEDQVMKQKQIMNNNNLTQKYKLDQVSFTKNNKQQQIENVQKKINFDQQNDMLQNILQDDQYFDVNCYKNLYSLEDSQFVKFLKANQQVIQDYRDKNQQNQLIIQKKIVDRDIFQKNFKINEAQFDFLIDKEPLTHQQKINFKDICFKDFNDIIKQYNNGYQEKYNQKQFEDIIKKIKNQDLQYFIIRNKNLQDSLIKEHKLIQQEQKKNIIKQTQELRNNLKLDSQQIFKKINKMEMSNEKKQRILSDNIMLQNFILDQQAQTKSQKNIEDFQNQQELENLIDDSNLKEYIKQTIKLKQNYNKDIDQANTKYSKKYKYQQQILQKKYNIDEQMLIKIQNNNLSDTETNQQLKAIQNFETNVNEEQKDILSKIENKNLRNYLQQSYQIKQKLKEDLQQEIDENLQKMKIQQSGLKKIYNIDDNEIRLKVKLMPIDFQKKQQLLDIANIQEENDNSMKNDINENQEQYFDKNLNIIQSIQFDKIPFSKSDNNIKEYLIYNNDLTQKMIIKQQLDQEKIEKKIEQIKQDLKQKHQLTDSQIYNKIVALPINEQKKQQLLQQHFSNKIRIDQEINNQQQNNISSQQFLSIIIDVDDQIFQQYLQDYQNLQNEKDQTLNQNYLQNLQRINNQQIQLQKKYKIDTQNLKQRISQLPLDDKQKDILVEQHNLQQKIYLKFLNQDPLVLNKKVQQYNDEINKLKQDLGIESQSIQKSINLIQDTEFKKFLLTDENYTTDKDLNSPEHQQYSTKSYIQFLSNNPSNLNSAIFQKNMNKCNFNKIEKYYLQQKQKLKEKIFVQQKEPFQDEYIQIQSDVKDLAITIDAEDIQKKINLQDIDQDIRKYIIQDLTFLKSIKNQGQNNENLFQVYRKDFNNTDLQNISQITKVINNLPLQIQDKQPLLMVQQFKKSFLKQDRQEQLGNKKYDQETLFKLKSYLDSDTFNKKIYNINSDQLQNQIQNMDCDRQLKQQVNSNMQFLKAINDIIDSSGAQYFNDCQKLQTSSEFNKIEHIESLRFQLKKLGLRSNEQKFILEHIIFQKDISTQDQVNAKKIFNAEIDFIQQYKININNLVKKIDEIDSEQDFKDQKTIINALQIPLKFLNNIQLDIENYNEKHKVEQDQLKIKQKLEDLDIGERQKSYLFINDKKTQFLKEYIWQKKNLSQDQQIINQRNKAQVDIFTKNNLKISDIITQVSNLDVDTVIKTQILDDLKQTIQIQSNETIKKNRILPETISSHISNLPLKTNTKNAILQQQNFLHNQNLQYQMKKYFEENQTLKHFIEQESNIYRTLNINSQQIEKKIIDSKLDNTFKKYLVQEQDVLRRINNDQSLKQNTSIYTYVQTIQASRQINNIQPDFYLKQVLNSDLDDITKTYLLEHFILQEKLLQNPCITKEKNKSKTEIIQIKKEVLDQKTFKKKNNIDIQSVIEKVQSSNIDFINKFQIIHDLKNLKNVQEQDEIYLEKIQIKNEVQIDIRKTLDISFYQTKLAIQNSNLDLKSKMYIINHQQYLKKNLIKNNEEQKKIKIYLQDENFICQQKQIEQEELIQKLYTLDENENIKNYLIQDQEFYKQLQNDQDSQQQTLQSILLSQQQLQKKYKIQEDSFSQQLNKLDLTKDQKSYLKERMNLKQEWFQLILKDTTEHNLQQTNKKILDIADFLQKNALKEQESIYQKYNLKQENIKKKIEQQNIEQQKKNFINDMLNIDKKLFNSLINKKNSSIIDENMSKIENLPLDQNIKCFLKENYNLAKKYNQISEEIISKNSDQIYNQPLFLTKNKIDTLQLKKNILFKIEDDEFKQYLSKKLDIYMECQQIKKNKNFNLQQQVYINQKVKDLNKQYKYNSKSLFQQIDRLDINENEKQFLLDNEIINRKVSKELQIIKTKLNHVDQFEFLRQKYKINNENLKTQIQNLYIHQNLKKELQNIQEIFDKKPLLEADRLYKQIELLPIQNNEKQYLIDCFELQKKYRQTQNENKGYYNKKSLASKQFENFLYSQEYFQDMLQINPEQIKNKVQNLKNDEITKKIIISNAKILESVRKFNDAEIDAIEIQKELFKLEEKLMKNKIIDSNKFLKDTENLNIEHNVIKYLLQQNYFLKRLRMDNNSYSTKQYTHKKQIQQIENVFSNNNVQKDDLIYKLQNMDMDNILKKFVIESIQNKENSTDLNISSQITDNLFQEEFLNKIDSLPLQFKEKKAIIQSINCYNQYTKKLKLQEQNHINKIDLQDDEQKLIKKYQIDPELLNDQIFKIQDHSVQRLIFEEHNFRKKQIQQDNKNTQYIDFIDYNKNFQTINSNQKNLSQQDILKQILGSEINQNYKQYLIDQQLLKQKYQILADNFKNLQKKDEYRQQKQNYIFDEQSLLNKNSLDVQNLIQSLKNIDDSIKSKQYLIQDLQLKLPFLQQESFKNNQIQTYYQDIKDLSSNINFDEVLADINMLPISQSQKKYLIQTIHLKRKYFLLESENYKKISKMETINIQDKIIEYINFIKRIDQINQKNLYNKILDLNCESNFKNYLLVDEQITQKLKQKLLHQNIEKTNNYLQQVEYNRAELILTDDQIIQKIKTLPLTQNEQQYLISKQIIQKTFYKPISFDFVTAKKLFINEIYMNLLKHQIDPYILQQKILDNNGNQNIKRIILSDLQLIKQKQSQESFRYYLQTQDQILKENNLNYQDFIQDIKSMNISRQEKQVLTNLQLFKKTLKKQIDIQKFKQEDENTKNNILKIYKLKEQFLRIRYKINQEELQRNVVDSNLPLNIKTFIQDALRQNRFNNFQPQLFLNQNNILQQNNIQNQEYIQIIQQSQLNQNEKNYLQELFKILYPLLNEEIILKKQNLNQQDQKVKDIIRLQQILRKRNRISSYDVYQSVINLPQNYKQLKDYLIDTIIEENDIKYKTGINQDRLVKFLSQNDKFLERNQIQQEQFYKIIHDLPINYEIKQYLLQKERLYTIYNLEDQNEFQIKDNSQDKFKQDSNQNILKTLLIDPLYNNQQSIKSQNSQEIQQDNINQKKMSQRSIQKDNSILQLENDQNKYLKITHHNLNNTSNLDLKNLISQRSIQRNQDRQYIKKNKSYDLLYIDNTNNSRKHNIQSLFKFENSEWYKKLRKKSQQNTSKHELRDFIDPNINKMQNKYYNNNINQEQIQQHINEKKTLNKNKDQCSSQYKNEHGYSILSKFIKSIDNMNKKNNQNLEFTSNQYNMQQQKNVDQKKNNSQNKQNIQQIADIYSIGINIKNQNQQNNLANYKVDQKQKKILNDFIRKHDDYNNAKNHKNIQQQKTNNIQKNDSKGQKIDKKDHSKNNKNNLQLQNQQQFQLQKKDNEKTNLSLENETFQNKQDTISIDQNQNQNYRHLRSNSTVLPKNQINFETFRKNENDKTLKQNLKKNTNKRSQIEEQIIKKNQKLQEEINARQFRKNSFIQPIKISKSAKQIRTKKRKQKINAHKLKEKDNKQNILKSQKIKKDNRKQEAFFLQPQFNKISIELFNEGNKDQIVIQQLDENSQIHNKYNHYNQILKKFLKLNNLIGVIDFVAINIQQKIFVIKFKNKNVKQNKLRKFQIKNLTSKSLEDLQRKGFLKRR